MKSTGIVRRIDELGRIVIPKEIRSVLNISSGDEIEIYTNDEEIILKKYSSLMNEKDKSDKLVSLLSSFVDGFLLITDCERVLTNCRFAGKKIPFEIRNIINERQNCCFNEQETFLFEDISLKGFFYFAPIIQNSNANGVIILAKNCKINKEDEVFIKVLKKIIENS